jgi:hypothetical protein
MLEKISSTERRGIACVFAAACLAFLAWAFPNMTQIITIPGAIICAGLAVFFLWPEIVACWSFVLARAWPKTLAAVFVVFLGASFGVGYWEFYVGPDNSVPSPSKPPDGGIALPPSLPIQSRMERFIFVCDVSPPTNEQEEAEQKARLQKNIRVWADSLGVDVSFADIAGGVQVNAEAKTPEAVARFLSMGIIYGVTTIIAEARRNGKQQIVVVRAQIPKNTMMIYGLIPDPNNPQLADGKKLLAQFLEVPDSACRMR